MRISRSVPAVLSLLAALAACSTRRPPAAQAQAQIPPAPSAEARPSTPLPPGTLLVRVLDLDGLPQTFTDVRLQGADGNPNTFADVTDEQGEFTFAGIPPGEYVASAGSASEGAVSDNYIVEMGPRAPASLVLALKQVESREELAVVSAGTAGLMDLKVASELTGDFISKVPLANRSIQDTVSMMPGVSSRRARRAASDGASANDVIDGGLSMQIPSAAIRSFKLITSGASAKYGEQFTGVAEIVTKSSGTPRGRDIPGRARAAGAQAAAGESSISMTHGTGSEIAYRVDGDPSPAPRSGERHARVEENAFASPLDEPLSTFGIDVDTASYSLVRSWLQGGQMPPPDAVRIEEIVNAFTYDDPGPSGGDAFLATMEVAGCPWAPTHRLVRIAVKGAPAGRRDLPPCRLVFLVDVSGSMDEPEGLPLVQASLKLLVRELRPEDRVALVVYAGQAGVVLEPTGGADKAMLEAAIDRLSAGGSTAGGEGILAAYALAEKQFEQGAINRVILATDGDFNVGVSSEGELVRLIEKEREKGVFLTVLGFGSDYEDDGRMEQLADHGNGNYAYVDSLEEGRRVLVTEAAGTLFTIAKDVKIQVEMNPALVAGYRLIGYENRLMAAQDFEDDRKDGGEIGAGHSVTALYEIVPASASAPAQRKSPKLRYQQAIARRDASTELMTLKLRWKEPEGSKSDLVEAQVVDEGGSFEQATDDLRWSAAVAAFGMLLRGSEHADAASWADVQNLAASAVGRDEDGRRAEMLQLARQAAALAPARVAGQ